MTDLISVILPVYNTEKYLNNCVMSIVQQTYKNFEVIVVDDGSNDNSISIAKELLESHGINHKIIFQENSGVAVARNKGIENSLGEWLICIDSDDWIDIDTFEILLDSVKDEPVVFFDFILEKRTEIYTKNNKDINFIEMTGPQAFHSYYSRKSKFISPAAMIRKDFLLKHKIYYDEQCKFAEDDLFVWKLLSVAENICYVKEKKYHYVMHDNSTMTSSTIDKYISALEPSIQVSKQFIDISYNSGKYKCDFLVRHLIGIIHTSCKTLDINDYKKLISIFNLNKLIRTNKCHLKLRITEVFIATFPILTYKIFRKI